METTLSAYRARFKREPSDAIWGYETEMSPTIGQYQIFVRNLSGKLQTLNVRSSDKIKDIKEMIRQMEGVKVCQQRLLGPGTCQLKDDRTVGDYNLGMECELKLVLRLCGC